GLRRRDVGDGAEHADRLEDEQRPHAFQRRLESERDLHETTPRRDGRSGGGLHRDGERFSRVARSGRGRRDRSGRRGGEAGGGGIQLRDDERYVGLWLAAGHRQADRFFQRIGGTEQQLQHVIAGTAGAAAQQVEQVFHAVGQVGD